MKKDSKKILLEKAESIFAKKGFSGTSTREIASAAKLNISSISYYFEGKKGLYQAILQQLVDKVSEALKDELPYAKEISENGTPKDAEECVCNLITSLCSFILSKDFSYNGIAIFLNEYTNPGEAFPIIYHGLIKPIHEIFTNLIVRASCSENHPEQKEMIMLYTFPLFSSLFVFKTREKTIIQHMNWKGYTENNNQKIIKVLLTQVKSFINHISQ
ncbi:MAG: CerR family C-terminal domain-containing protein [Alphaproteobacteria bacterium]|nr:CerR family C-terminal domain-containing protein [Alphaproteobacteria bacterium]